MSFKQGMMKSKLADTAYLGHADTAYLGHADTVYPGHADTPYLGHAAHDIVIMSFK